MEADGGEAAAEVDDSIGFVGFQTFPVQVPRAQRRLVCTPVLVVEAPKTA